MPRIAQILFQGGNGTAHRLGIKLDSFAEIFLQTIPVAIFETLFGSLVYPTKVIIVIGECGEDFLRRLTDEL